MARKIFVLGDTLPVWCGAEILSADTFTLIRSMVISKRVLLAGYMARQEETLKKKSVAAELRGLQEAQTPPLPPSFKL